MLSRIPIRLRLSLVFAVTMAVVLAGLGAFVYLRLGSDLGQAIDQSLRTRADDLAALARRSDSALAEGGVDQLVDEDESFAQILDVNGRIVDASPGLANAPLLSPAEATEAAGHTIVLDRRPSAISEEPYRVLATSTRAQNETLIVVVGASLESRNEALSNLLLQLLIGGTVALFLASGAGFLLAVLALRPVEAMRNEAEAISASEPGRRLPVPPAEDEIRRLGLTLNEMLARLEGAIARERRFVDDASHELRTPLALMKAELELALRRTRSQEQLVETVRSAAEETDRLAQLAEDLLVIARSDHGKLPIRLDDLAAAGVLETVANRFRSRASDAGRIFVVDTQPSLRVSGDALRLEQALGNAVENSLRYGNGTITLLARAPGVQVELHVTDAGPGFPEAFLPHAFERFSRADEARTRGGTGLGLAIVDVIARAHGGSAHAANRPEGGADVWLVLPRLA